MKRVHGYFFLTRRNSLASLPEEALLRKKKPPSPERPGASGRPSSRLRRKDLSAIQISRAASPPPATEREPEDLGRFAGHARQPLQPGPANPLLLGWCAEGQQVCLLVPSYIQVGSVHTGAAGGGGDLPEQLRNDLQVYAPQLPEGLASLCGVEGLPERDSLCTAKLALAPLLSELPQDPGLFHELLFFLQGRST